MAYTHKNKKGQLYYLHSQKVKLRGSGKEQIIYFFAREERRNAIDELPQGYMVKEVAKTGLPLLKKK